MKTTRTPMVSGPVNTRAKALANFPIPAAQAAANARKTGIGTFDDRRTYMQDGDAVKHHDMVYKGFKVSEKVRREP
jgi:hypothetical protein